MGRLSLGACFMDRVLVGQKEGSVVAVLLSESAAVGDVLFKLGAGGAGGEV